MKNNSPFISSKISKEINWKILSSIIKIRFKEKKWSGERYR